MKISLNWLKDYIPDLKLDNLDKFVDDLVELGFDIESIENEGDIFKNFVVGEVIEKAKHPDADKLSLCKVNVGGSELLNIVCGAPNVEAGQKVCVAMIGAIVPNGQFEIKKSKIRGAVSEGMICSAKELNLTDDHSGIMVLDANAKPGTPFSDFLDKNDYIFDIWVPPNRGDLSSHIGMAREIAALYNLKLNIPKTDKNYKDGVGQTQDFIKISIEDKENCKRFTGRLIKDIKVGESPDWLKKKLIAVGLRPINNIVDITNYVMFETGQPLHAFDYDKIRGKEIIVKRANKGDKFTTLDSKQRELNENSLMICDKNGYVGIAGIMGGENSEITSDTKNFFLEVAYFNPISIRKNAKRLGMLTDASTRFEKGVDINGVEQASLRATHLIKELANGKVSDDLYDVYPEKFASIEIGIRAQMASKVIGVDITEDEIKSLLEKIEIKFIKKDGDNLIFAIPEFRRYDIEREYDLIEEVMRLKGYNTVRAEERVTMSFSSDDKYTEEYLKTLDIKDYLTGRGFNEIITQTIQNSELIKIFGINPVLLENPQSAELNALRVNLDIGLLRVVKNNINHSGKEISLKLYEAGKIFRNGNKYIENNELTMAFYGLYDFKTHKLQKRRYDIFDVKGEIEMFLQRMNIENVKLFYYNDLAYSSNFIEVRISDRTIGKIYKANADLLNKFEIEGDVFIGSLNLDLIIPPSFRKNYYREISKFPVVKRDLAIVVDKKTKYEELVKILNSKNAENLKSVELFDIYEDDKLGKDKKSLAFSLEFLSKDKTLSDEEVNAQIKKLVKKLESETGAVLRN
ncbi:MAG TPA: phenylalanine--tRNA ligase subunit beta [Ignavibacteria bacterium]|nr:phenylalanine--tRNA ligase subunit beta [Ignavibacteria bacterium]